MTNLKEALQAELVLVDQLITLLDRRSGKGVLYIPEKLEDFVDELTSALTTPITDSNVDTSLLPFIIKGPEGVGLDMSGDSAFLYGLFDRQKRLQERIAALEELDTTPESLV